MPTASVSRIIAAPQERVWALLADIANAGRWNKAWGHIEFLSEHREGIGTTFRAHTNEGPAFDFQVTRWLPPKFIAFAPVRSQDDPPYLITLESQAFRLSPVDEGHTRVELVASASARGVRGFLLGLVLWRGYQKGGLHKALDSLQTLCEPERAEPEPLSRSDG